MWHPMLLSYGHIQLISGNNLLGTSMAHDDATTIADDISFTRRKVLENYPSKAEP